MDEARRRVRHPSLNERRGRDQQLLGLFDVPAFARRGQDLEYAPAGCTSGSPGSRLAMLDMVRLRLRQWAAVATGPDDWPDAFAQPIAPLWALAGASEPCLGVTARAARAGGGPSRATLLPASIGSTAAGPQFLDGLPLDPLNRRIDQYNRYYVLEKECVLGSARLAARHFVSPAPRDRLRRCSPTSPCLPAPERVGLRRADAAVGGLYVRALRSVILERLTRRRPWGAARP